MKESNTENIFHFTREFKNLVSIIEEENFWVCYSLEKFDFLNDSNPLYGQILLENEDNPKEEGVIAESFAYPMVCFCDIPIDERILNHANDRKEGYGCFGIGMKRSWANKQGIAPVHYIPVKSNIAKLWNSILVSIPHIQDVTKEFGSFESFFKDLINLGTYIKPYKNDHGNIYYEEREWRYYPPIEAFGEIEKRFLMESIYYEAKHENRLKSTFELTFSIDKDVDYIIVPERYESEIKSLINDRKIEIILYEKIGKITSFDKY